MTEKVVKYSVTMIECNTYNVSILFVTTDLKEALSFLSSYLNDNYELNDYLKAYYDTARSLTLYKYFYFKSKQMVTKFQIIEFNDTLVSDYSLR